jgi:hypothetical protein
MTEQNSSNHAVALIGKNTTTTVSPCVNVMSPRVWRTANVVAAWLR